MKTFRESNRSYITTSSFLVGLLVLSLGLVISSCDISSVIDETGRELPPREGNPRDPNSGDAQPPMAAITSHDTTQTVTLSEPAVQLSWEATDQGVTDSLEYQYRLAQSGANIDEQEWSSWSSETTASFFYLEESLDGGEYNFQIRARSRLNTDLVQETPSQMTFMVDTISDQGLMFRPRNIVPEGDTYTTEVWLHNIKSAAQLVGVKGIISFDAGAYELQSIDLHDGEGDDSSLLAASGGDLFGFSSSFGGTIEFNIGILEGDLTQIQGSGKIATLTFTATGEGVPSEIRLENGSKLKKNDGSDITPTVLDAAQFSN